MGKLPGIIGVICQSLTSGQWSNLTCVILKLITCCDSVPYHSTFCNLRQEEMDSLCHSPFWPVEYCPIKCTLVYRHQLFFLLNVSFFLSACNMVRNTGCIWSCFFWSIRVRGYYVSALSTPFRLLLTYSNKRRGGFADSGPDCFAQPNFDTNGESRSHGGSKLTALETRIATII